ncbi:hypothetical protein ACS0TY_032737 [Phlomoides rotata]
MFVKKSRSVRMVKASGRHKKPCSLSEDDTHIPVHRKRTRGQEYRLCIKGKMLVQENDMSSESDTQHVLKKRRQRYDGKNYSDKKSLNQDETSSDSERKIVTWSNSRRLDIIIGANSLWIC